jgi:hypothetical protein
MTNYEYDPELPFVVVRIKEGETGEFRPGIIARFRSRSDAIDMEEIFQPGWVEMVDTTPKPKIPAEATYITWVAADREPRIAFRYGHPANKVWSLGVDWYPEGELEDVIGDNEVTVLVPKEDL